MPAIVTNKLRIANGDYFKRSVDATPTYVYFGGTTAWEDESLPDDTIDSTRGHIDALNDVVGLKRILSGTIEFVIPRIDWQQSIVYDEYDDSVNMIDDKNILTDDYYRFYVFTDEFGVYKCLSNNNRSPSLNKPSGFSTEPFMTPDGYIWKYMYTVRASDAFSFMTPNWIPCYTLDVEDGSSQWNVQQAAVRGTIDDVRITNAGESYASATPPTVTITGDGTGATAVAEIDDVTGTVSRIVITNRGQGYTTATVEITSTVGGLATAVPVISPVEGHGADARAELGAVFVMVRVTIDGDENGVLRTDVAYRRSGMVIEPRSTTEGTVMFVDNVEYFRSNETITGQTSGATAKIESVSEVRKCIYVSGIVGTFQISENISSNVLSSTQIQYTSTEYHPLTQSVIDGTLYQPLTGSLSYMSNREKITRGSNQIEEIRFIVSF